MQEPPAPSPPPSSATAEQPTASARIRLSLRPVEIEGAAEGVPAAEAHALITTFGMIAMGMAGITGAGLTVYVASSQNLGWYLGLALAELGLALTVILLIARRDQSRQDRGSQTSADRASEVLEHSAQALAESRAKLRARAERERDWLRQSGGRGDHDRDSTPRRRRRRADRDNP